MKHFGKVIFINGPSSAGKTTLSKALQEALDEPFLHLGIDSMIAMMPEKYNDWLGESVTKGFYQVKTTDSHGNPVSPVRMADYGLHMSNMLMELVVHLVKLGNNVIVDEVCMEEERFDIWKKRLKNFKVLYVGMKLPIDVLEDRESQRPNRLQGSVRGTQICPQIQYDLEISNSNIGEMVSKIIDGLSQITEKT